MKTCLGKEESQTKEELTEEQLDDIYGGGQRTYSFSKHDALDNDEDLVEKQENQNYTYNYAEPPFDYDRGMLDGSKFVFSSKELIRLPVAFKILGISVDTLIALQNVSE